MKTLIGCRAGLLLATAAIVAIPAAAHAQAVPLSIPAQSLEGALNSFARQSGQQLMFTPQLVAGRRATPVQGRYTASRALGLLLAGSGLTYHVTSAGAFVLSAAAQPAPVPAPRGARSARPLSQAAPAATDPDAPGDDRTIIVTAERRSENLQRVPITINTFSGAQLAARGVDNTLDLPARTTNLLISTNVIFGQPYIRGIGNSTLTIGSDSSVAVHLDGVYLARPMSAIQDFFDVERVEVLKGPQGTLYGRNATGGVINIISAAPTDHLTARAEVQLGNYARNRFAATISGPLGDGINGRITFLRSNHDGYVHNLFDNSRLEDEDVFGLRGEIAADPTDRFHVTLSADLFHEDDTRGQGLKSVIRGAGSAGYTIPPDPHDVRKDYPSRTQAHSGGAAMHAEWTLGDYLLRSITAYRHSDFDLALDLDLSDRAFAFVDPETERSNSESQELQLVSPHGGRFEWLGGLYYFHENAETLFNINLIQSGINQQPNGFNRTNAYAIYGQGSYWIVPEQLRLTLGGRYSFERKSGRVITNFPAPTRTDSGQGDWGAFTPRVSLDYFPDQNVMLYVSATRGFKSGGFNATARGLPRFDPEYVWNYEAGLRSTFADGRVRANFSAFHYDYRDLQVRALVSGVISSVTNAGAARVNGAELELSLNPVRPFMLDAGIAYLDARFTDFATTNPDVGPAPINLAGNLLPRAPHWTANVGAQYDVDLASAGTLALRGDLQYQGRTYFDEFNDPTRRQDSFATLAARATWTSARNRWSVALWGRNLTDKDYVTNALRSAGTYGTAYQYGAPRTYGVTFGVRY